MTAYFLFEGEQLVCAAVAAKPSYDGPMSRTTLKMLIAVVLPPAAIAILGTTHPQHLTQDDSLFWRNLHVVLLPLFPLLALGPGLVAKSVDAKFGRIALLLGFVFATFYTALDVLAGIGAGGLKHEGKNGLGVLFDLASTLGEVGSIAFIGATAIAAGCVIHVAKWKALPGTLLVLAGAFGFMEEHVYWPGGVLSMVALAAGWALLVGAQRYGDEHA